MLRFAQSDKDSLFAGHASAFRKKSRVLAIQMTEAFLVETDRGVMRGEAGDWLMTNHPEDDAASDLWSISDERMQSTYEEVRPGADE